jgi:RNA polymerase sigma-70 factor (ECF subfamily)
MIARPNDRELIERIARQDRDAFRELYERYGGPVLSYVRTLARDRELSEDVTQEVFLSVWRKAPTYRPDRGEVAAWLYTIARNQLVDLWRRRSTRGDKEDTSVDLTRFESQQREDEVRVVSLAVRKALASLKREQREALELAYFGGLTYEETAQRLGLPLGTLKSRIRAGLAVLRSALSTTEPSHDGSPSGSPWS